MKTIIPMLATLALAVPVSAYNEADFQRFLKTKKCPNCNLSGIKLRCKKSYYKATSEERISPARTFKRPRSGSPILRGQTSRMPPFLRPTSATQTLRKPISPAPTRGRRNSKMHPRQGHDGEQQALGCKAKESQAPQRSPARRHLGGRGEMSKRINCKVHLLAALSS